MREFLKTNRLALCLLVLAFILNQSISAWAGYLSPDSEGYILLARTLFAHGYPGLQGHYDAVWPPGYPALIGLPTLAHSHSAIFYSSKVVNALLWLGCACVLLRRYPGRLLPVFLLVSPFALHIASYTWSENLFVLALVLTVHLQLGGLEQPRSRLALLCALVAGISSRYAFGLLMPALYVCRGLVGGRAVWRRQLPVFVIAAGLFLAYLALNRTLTGFVSGSARSPATESAATLLAAFVRANFASILQCLLPLIVVLLLGRVRLGWSRAASFLVLSGASYIALIAVLRAHSAFDIYSVRLLGPGWFLIGMALLEATRDEPVRLPGRLIVLLCLLTVAGSLARVHYRLAGLYGAGQLSTPVARQIESKLAAFSAAGAANVFYFRLADMPPLADNLPELQFEGRTFRQLQPGQNFTEAREAVAGLQALPGGCTIDFTPFATREAFDAFLSGADPSIKAGFAGIFEPGRVVDCHRMGTVPAR
ncbi:hypothetical protein [Radicibacter daui]|uniref:hypothetical protein n=1 Tax=Radicibacter daui TaxID=3064829 RepID=UPI004046C720